MAGCGLQKHDKQGWQVLGADRFLDFIQRRAGRRDVWNNQGVCKVDEGTDIILGRDVGRWQWLADWGSLASETLERQVL